MSKELPIVNVSAVDTIASPEMPNLSLESPATLFMTDFYNTHPVTVGKDTPVDHALALMRDSYVRLLLVVNPGDSLFQGIVTASDINGGKVLSYMSTNGVHHRDEVFVSHIMLGRDDIHALNLEDVEDASIGDVIRTIRHLGEQHVLVLEDSKYVRGLFSTTDIAKSLRVRFDVEPHARTFFELEQAILHHEVAR